jgi:hypothetical protein
MKSSFWDILTILILLILGLMVVCFVIIFLNPALAINPYPPPTLPATIIIPSETLMPRLLPPTWTTTPKPSLLQPSASSTTPPSSTRFDVLTLTPLPTITPTSTYTALPTGTPASSPYQCSVVIKPPLDGSKLVTPNDGFDGYWILINTGTKYWDSGLIEAIYISGIKFQKYDDPLRFNRDVPLGGSVELIADMTVPEEIGTHYSTWSLVYQDTTICTWSFTLRVK